MSYQSFDFFPPLQIGFDSLAEGMHTHWHAHASSARQLGLSATDGDTDYFTETCISTHVVKPKTPFDEIVPRRASHSEDFSWTSSVNDIQSRSSEPQDMLADNAQNPNYLDSKGSTWPGISSSTLPLSLVALLFVTPLAEMQSLNSAFDEIDRVDSF